ALAAVREAFADVPFPDRIWPRVSVVLCSYNGSRTIRDCLEGLAGLDYPDFEVIVVDDGSVDDTAKIAGEYEVLLIRTANRGLSSARNTGIEAATGEIVDSLDVVAYLDLQKSKYIVTAFAALHYAGWGGH